MAIFSLSDAERDAVTAAVSRAESGTDGEIVTILTRRSDAYHDVALHYAVAAVLLVTTLAAVWPGPLVRLATSEWNDAMDLGRLMLALLIAQTIAFLVVRLVLAWLPLRLTLTPRATKGRRVRRRAVQYFKVGAERRTQARVGILLYLSLDERAAEIVADEAIHGVVPPETWGAAMAALVDEVRAGRPGAGMVAAVDAIGTVLAEHFPKTEADVNELPDRLIEL